MQPEGGRTKSTSESRPPDGRPIFIGGDGRSGTTLLAVVLDSHPALAVGPELHFKGPSDLGPYVLSCLDLVLAGDRRVAGDAVNGHPDLKPGIQFVRRVQRAGIEPADLQTLTRAAIDATGSDLESFPDRCVLIHGLGEWLAARDGKRRWGFKIMKGIKNPRRYARVWPGAQFIHLIRDGRDVAASQMLEHQGWGYEDMEAAARGWVAVIERSRRNLGDASALEVRYEDLVQDPPATVGRILEFLDVPWDDAVLRHHEIDHRLFTSPVRHPSREATTRPINDSAIGRHRRDLSAAQIEVFERVAGGCLDALGYARRDPGAGAGARDDDAPPIIVDFQLGETPCPERASCRRMAERAMASLSKKYLGVEGRFPEQIRTAVIDLRGLTYDDYIAGLKKRYKGNVVRDARKSDKAGFACRPFARKLHVPDIVEINHSKDQRCGKPMREAYLKSVEEMGGAPRQPLEPEPPSCTRHYDTWWGVFAPEPGYTQGDVVTNERLLAYIDFRRLGSLALYSLIIGHGDYLKHGLMYRLHFAVMEWICAREDPATHGLDHLMYGGFDQGGDGLQLWKKKTCFEPGALLLHTRPGALAESGPGIWRKLRRLITS